MWLPDGKRDIDAINELEQASDRAVGIIAGAMVDSKLYDTISKYLYGDDAYSAKIRKEMFNADGALGSFGARTNLAYLIGLLTPEAHADLQTFGKIRNSFAHYTEHDTFETESIKARCANFKLIERHVRPAASERTERGTTEFQDSIRILGDKTVLLHLSDHDTALSTPKGRFIATTKLFCAVFSTLEDENHETLPLI